MLDYHVLSWWVLIVLLSVGLVLLCLGGEWLARGASALAIRMKINPVVVGLTVVSIATSMPELITSFIAASRGSAGLAIGNIVGSNLGNAGLILGIAALICPIAIQTRLIWKEVPILLFVTVAFTIMSMSGFFIAGRIGYGEGLLLLAGAAGYLYYITRQAKRAPAAERAELAMEFEDELGKPPGRLASCLGLVAGGTLALSLGAEFLVGSAVETAIRLSVSEVLIGLTIVAVGTSLPELAASVAAALRKETDIVAGNIVGSNIFNMLLIGGGVASVYTLPVDARLMTVEFPAMLLITVLLWFAFFTGKIVTRREGALFLTLYLGIIGLSVYSHVGAQ